MKKKRLIFTIVLLLSVFSTIMLSYDFESKMSPKVQINSSENLTYEDLYFNIDQLDEEEVQVYVKTS